MVDEVNKIRSHKIKNGNIFLCCKINGETRELFSLNFNDKRELFYIFPSDSTQKIDILQDSKWITQRRDDHVTFHRDGKIHTRFKKENRKEKGYRFNAKSKVNIFDVDSNSVLPLSLHSFFIGSALDNLEQLDISNKKILADRINDDFPLINLDKNTITWELSELKDFSVLLFVLGKDLNPSTLPANHPLSLLMDKNYMQPILLPWSSPSDFFSDSKLWIIFSSKVVHCPNEYKEIAKKRSDNFNPMAWHLHSYGICPPWKEIDKMK